MLSDSPFDDWILGQAVFPSLGNTWRKLGDLVEKWLSRRKILKNVDFNIHVANGERQDLLVLLKFLENSRVSVTFCAEIAGLGILSWFTLLRTLSLM
jgi:hypothetical protein